MLPGFNAEVSLHPAKNIYRTYFSTSTARKSAPLQIRLADPLSHCQQLCASACSSVPQNEYSFCFQSCFNGCYQSTQGPASTVGYCNASEYQRCLNQFGNEPSLSGSCYLYYGPCGSSCCGEGANRSCTSLKTNPLNCGRCGNMCVEGASCCGGNCCGGTGTNLGCCTYTGLEGTISSCVPLLPDGRPSGESNNIYNCGQCGTMCTTTKSNAYPVCQNGQCSFECNSGYFNCGGNCIPICSGGQTCINGSCQCPPGSPNFCNNQCVNYKTDNNSCGSCGKVCVGGQTCINGVCTCPGNAPKFCGNNCVNTTNDNNDCGGCGNVCTGGRQCINSSCQCTGGTTWCNGSCRNLKTDPNNCGSCNNSCTSGVCQNGTCKSVQPARCPSGQQLFTFEIGGVVQSICCNSELNIFVPEVGPPVCCPNGICTNETFTYCADSNGNC